MEYPKVYRIDSGWYSKHVLVKDRMEELALKGWVDEQGYVTQTRVWLYSVPEIIKKEA